MQKMIPTLTDRQRYWLEHVQACEAAGKTIVEYAADQEFCAQDMYAGKSVLVKKGVLATARPTRFQRVQVMEATVSEYSGPRLPPIPVEGCHPFRLKVATDSGEGCHP